VIEFLRTFLAGRKAAYQRTFNKESRDAQFVLADLARFCRATRSTFHPDHAISDRLDGRREVFLRIAEHLNLSTDELYALYHGAQKNPAEAG
jgi:hypothetical protein